MGGRRKVEAAQQFARDLGVQMRNVAYVGDSITDDAMHAHLNAEGGLPIAVNGNKYALRNARIAVATRDMRNLRPILDAWNTGGFDGILERAGDISDRSFTSRREGEPRSEASRFRWDLVNPRDTVGFKDLVAVHKEYRTLVRGAATARLG